MNRYSLLCLFSVAVCGMAGTAEAATVSRTFYQNGGSACTGALPTFEGALRKRPKAIANVGTTTSFITCSAVGNDQNTAMPHLAFVYVTNRSAAPVDLSCTFINGDEYYGSASVPQTVNLPVNVLTSVFWFPESPDPTFLRDAVSVSCALPPGVEVNLFGQSIQQDVGL